MERDAGDAYFARILCLVKLQALQVLNIMATDIPTVGYVRCGFAASYKIMWLHDNPLQNNYCIGWDIWHESHLVCIYVIPHRI